jgi:3-methyladenine DNA glycosylase AlkD
MHPYCKKLLQRLQAAADPAKIAGMEAYMLHQFKFLGVIAPLRRQTIKTYLKENKLQEPTNLEAFVRECLHSQWREMNYAGIEILSYHKKQWQVHTINLIEECLVTKSWWDTVDHTASECLGAYFEMFSKQIIPITATWNQSNNIWLQRSSIMFQKSFKTNTNKEILAKYILHLSTSKEFFVQKAIGWALREYATCTPPWVKAFVQKHHLSSLSKREALKRLS